ncbi:IclR family transcriptional regulator [Microlunatus soli]|uniref:DNA-binding transcriptional regulator, IclR family n=1 Tax=Microlunatus soli TaxID=630515 RepID=A0A1H1ZIL9_9ACTN|nr:IclR family transcriptional regulator [Microlunatus soli]SDT33534.1 DNA-binding transcriptional regulator, IclR family [Microlunatus soli]
MAQTIQSVDRAIDILWMVSRTPDLTLSELADTAGLLPSTAHRLLATLEQHELIERNSRTRRYQLGRGVLRLAGVTDPAHEEVRRRLEPQLEQLAAAVGEQVAVGVLVERRQLNIAVVDGARDAGEEVVLRSDHSRASADLNATAVGKVLLAYASDDEAQTMIDGLTFEARSDRTITSAGKLRQQLARVRRLGYATCVGENFPDVNGIAAPIHGGDGGVAAALCVNGPATRLAPRRLQALLPVLRETAAECSRLLGLGRVS